MSSKMHGVKFCPDFNDWYTRCFTADVRMNCEMLIYQYPRRGRYRSKQLETTFGF